MGRCREEGGGHRSAADGARPRTSTQAYNETAAAFLTGDRVLEDLETEERLDANIDRALRRLYQLKAARQLHPPGRPKLIESKSPPQLEHRDAKTRKGKE